METKKEIQHALTTAMKEKDEDTKRTLRLVMASIKLAEIEKGGDIDDSRVLSILQKEVKTRQDAIEEAQQANRKDLISTAENEIAILRRFLPQQLDQEALKNLIIEVINETGAKDIGDMGLVMKSLAPKLAGRASGQEASKLVQSLLKK